MASLCSRGKTVLLTTHYMEEARHLANRVGVIVGGRPVTVGTPAELAGERGGAIRFRLPQGVAPEELPVVGTGVEIDGQVVEIASTAPTRDLQTLTSWAVERGLELEDLALAPPSFEDTYLRLVEETTEASHG